MKSASIVVTCFVDSKCDASAGENFLNCPPDCLSGSADGVCDAVSDSKCDPDCAVDVDSDCAVTQPAKENITTPVNETKELPNATNITPPIAPTQPGTKSTSSTGGFDFKANAIYIVGITVVAIVLYFLLRRKKSPT